MIFEKASNFRAKSAAVTIDGKSGLIAHPFSEEYIINSYVETQMASWEQIKRNEKAKKYKKRVNDKTRSLQEQIFRRTAIQKYGTQWIDVYGTFKILEYDGANSSLIFKIADQNIHLAMPPKEAISIQENQEHIYFRNPKFDFIDGQVRILSLEVYYNDVKFDAIKR